MSKQNKISCDGPKCDSTAPRRAWEKWVFISMQSEGFGCEIDLCPQCASKFLNDHVFNIMAATFKNAMKVDQNGNAS